MKKNYIFVSLFVGAIGLLSFNSNNSNEITAKKQFHKFATGSPGGKTGAPSESNCIDCHSGGTVLSGAGINTLIVAQGVTPVTTYIPGQTYNVAIACSASTAKNGFEVVALTSTGAVAGTMSVNTNFSLTTQAITVGGSPRITHNAAGSLINTWVINWQAPATNVGSVTFYLAYNATNNVAGSAGDKIYTSQHILGVNGIEEQAVATSITVGFAKNTNSLVIDVNGKENGTSALNLVDMTGKTVQYEALGNVESGENTFHVKLNSELPKGVYVAHVNVNNNFYTKKIYID